MANNFDRTIRSGTTTPAEAPQRHSLTLARCFHTIAIIRFTITVITALYVEGPDNSVGIANRYGLDGPGIEPRWERGFPHPSRPAPGPTQPPIQLVPGLFSRGKAAGAWR
jgi:hypothetical protein